MSRCINCNKEIELKNEWYENLAKKCPYCETEKPFRCWNCFEEINIKNDSECKMCGFFICSKCNLCGMECKSLSVINDMKNDKIWKLLTKQEQRYLMNKISESLSGKKNKSCFRKVPISYAKQKNRSLLLKLNGLAAKGKYDTEKFHERYNYYKEKEYGEKFTINETRDYGTYGQEERDALNLLICHGFYRVIEQVIKSKTVKKYERCNEGVCPYFKEENLYTTDEKGERKKRKGNVSCCTLNRTSFTTKEIKEVDDGNNSRME